MENEVAPILLPFPAPGFPAPGFLGLEMLVLASNSLGCLNPGTASRDRLPAGAGGEG